MRVVVYQPAGPALDPDPFGAGWLIAAIESALRTRGHELTQVPSDRAGADAVGAGAANRLVARYLSAAPAPPDLWLSYRVSSRSPDAVGPAICSALKIPYVLVHPAADDESTADCDTPLRKAIAAADMVIVFSSAQARSIGRCLVDQSERLIALSPFIEMHPVIAARRLRPQYRAMLATKLRMSQAAPWIIAAGPMTDERHSASFRLIARAMSKLRDLDWSLIVAASGPGRRAVEPMFRSLPPASHRHVAVAGADELWTLLLAGDLFLWPSLDEDLSVTALAAQAAGLGVVAGRSSAMLDVVADGQTGMLVNPGNDASIANAVGFLLRHPEFRRNLSERAPGWVMANFEMKAVARRLDAALRRACEPRAANGPAP